MKKILLPLLVILQTVFIAGAQPPPRRDSVFLWGGSPNAPYYNAILRAPVVSGESQPIIIVPNRGQYCFDKQIKVKSVVNDRTVEQCLLVNTQDGLTGYLKPQIAAGGDLCDIKPADEHFWFSIFSLKGNVYSYHNTPGKRGGPMNHWVSTGNTERYLYQTPSNTGVYTLRNKHERRQYCNEKITATAYKYQDGGPTVYIFGKQYPDEIHVSSNKYIGNFGIGYQYTDKGLYIIMEMNSGGYSSKITSIEEEHVCFDASPFVVLEEQFKTKQQEDIEKERQRIAKREVEAQDATDCKAEKMALIAFDKEHLRKLENISQVVSHGQGNIYNNQQMQAAYISLNDPLEQVRGLILTTDASLCGAHAALNKHPGDNDAISRINCLTELRGKLIAAKSQMEANNNTYTRNLSKARALNSKILLQVTQQRCE